MALSDSAFQKLQGIVGVDRCTRSLEECACYAYDAAAGRSLPDAVLFPETAAEISAVLICANAERFFVVPRGSGSGMTGGSVPVQGGVVLVMSRMNRILAIDTENLVAHAEPGVITGKFHAAVEKEGLFYPPDPSSSDFSTLGGNLAECAGGPKAIKYGVTRDYVLGLEAVLPTGEIIRTGVQTTKGVAGYDLTRLLVGSEGTLGIITRMTLKLLPLPQSVMTLTAVFHRLETATETVSEIIRRGIIPRTLEFMDNASIRCVERHLKMGLPVDAGALLLIETDGDPEETIKTIKKLQDVCRTNGAYDVRTAATADEAQALWKARKAISPALFQYAPHKINEDIVVPRSRIPQMIRRIESLREKTGLFMASFGHAGDGNIHFNIMLDKNDPAALKKAEDTVEEIFDYTVELGGTLSGEHGIGITKAPYLSKEIGPEAIALMKRIKKAFDPNGILNPGKIFPPH
ncbi:MAG: glycolate oxidase subunit GlcD [Desulfobacterales bacterium CG07_land_8_20_14_0_80_52_14]|nr:MAG: glycolate oxidase subunit GlcD [Desulfobacterales bacterium CG23_combo_of_CG06-09_8_20_14_all_52_9]PIU50501.1 MAG: glycolate oxidase subunit GlcD [Desulfobacterales bacterium CG07_land_8_20_14_0_80_52_14]